jgi:hypothetical protein
MTTLLNIKYIDWYQDKKPLQLGFIDSKYQNLERALLLTEFQSHSMPYYDLYSIQSWKFIMCDALYLMCGKSANECSLDNRNVIQINLCKRKGTNKFQFLWVLRHSNNEITGDEGLRIKTNIVNIELRTSDELKCLSDIVEAYYDELTRLKLKAANVPKAGRLIKYQNKTYKIKNCHFRSNRQNDLMMANPFDLILKLENNKDSLDKIQNSLDWHVFQCEQYIEGEVKCNQCKQIVGISGADTRFVRGHGLICGPCRDYLFENEIITDNMWDDKIS